MKNTKFNIDDEVIINEDNETVKITGIIRRNGILYYLLDNDADFTPAINEEVEFLTNLMFTVPVTVLDTYGLSTNRK